MSLVVATEAAKVRRRVGSPDTTELPEADLQAFFTVDALDWLNRRRPNKTITSLTTVNGQQDYDVKPSGAYRIIDVWWLEASWLTFSPSMKVVPGALDIDDQLVDFSTIDNPALVEAFYKKVSHYRDFFKGKGEETADGKVRLIPNPTNSDDTVYFCYTSARWSAVTSVSDEYVEAVRFHAMGCAAEYLSTKRGVITGGRNWSGGAGRNEAELAKKFFTQADALVPDMPVISIG